jgi:cellulose biosynthesis protein BcsQ
MECIICVEKKKDFFNCKNDDCEMKKCCIECMKKYLLLSSKEPHCMSCHLEIPMSDFITLFSKHWRLGVYKEHNKNILWAKEQSRINEALDILDRKIKVKELKEQQQELIYEINKIHRQIILIENNKTKIENEYKYKCPIEDCNGSLNDDTICIVCEKNFCKDCFIELKKDTKKHICNEDLKATISQIKREAKPCPNCGEMISKQSGCNQMFCVKENCGTAFDWNTGKIEKGRVHNPHAFAYYTAHPEARDKYLARVNGNEPLGNCMVDQAELSRKLIELNIINVSERNDMSRIAVNLYNFRNYRTIPTHNNNIDLRLKFLKKELNEDSIKKTLHMRYKKVEKEIMDYEILQMCSTVLNDLLRLIIDCKKRIDYFNIRSEFKEIINYTNEQLQINSNYFELKNVFVSDTFTIY